MKQKISYQDLSILVKTLQYGSDEAAGQLVQYYESYCRKFVSVLKVNNFSLGDKTQRNFLSLFVKDPDTKKNLRLFRKSHYIQRRMYATLFRIRDIYSAFDEDELYHEAVLVLLDMAHNHNWEAPFHIYVAQYFPLKFYKVVKEMSRYDRDVELIGYSDDDIRMSCSDTYEEEVRHIVRPTTPTEFDENWVNGITCSAPFDELSIYERRIIKWYYEWKTLSKHMMSEDVYKERKARYKITETDIADRLACSRKTVNLRRNEVKRQLEDAARYLHLIKE